MEVRSTRLAYLGTTSERIKKETFMLIFAMIGFITLAQSVARAQNSTIPKIGLINNRANGSGPYDHDGCGSPQIWPKGRAQYGQGAVGLGNLF